MKTGIFLLTVLLIFSSVVYAGDYVRGYMRKDGTYVQPHYRSNPDSTPMNNYDFKGNANPFTGQKGDNYYKDNPRSPYYDGSASHKSKGLFE